MSHKRCNFRQINDDNKFLLLLYCDYTKSKFLFPVICKLSLNYLLSRQITILYVNIYEFVKSTFSYCIITLMVKTEAPHKFYGSCCCSLLASINFHDRFTHSWIFFKPLIIFKSVRANALVLFISISLKFITVYFIRF